MISETNFQRIQNFNDKELAIFLSHIIDSDNLAIETLSEIQKKHKDVKPKNFDTILFWLNGPAY